jgi:hypothetical protein
VIVSGNAGCALDRQMLTNNTQAPGEREVIAYEQMVQASYQIYNRCPATYTGRALFQGQSQNWDIVVSGHICPAANADLNGDTASMIDLPLCVGSDIGRSSPSGKLGLNLALGKAPVPSNYRIHTVLSFPFLDHFLLCLYFPNGLFPRST